VSTDGLHAVQLPASRARSARLGRRVGSAMVRVTSDLSSRPMRPAPTVTAQRPGPARIRLKCAAGPRRRTRVGPSIRPLKVVASDGSTAVRGVQSVELAVTPPRPCCVPPPREGLGTTFEVGPPLAKAAMSQHLNLLPPLQIAVDDAGPWSRLAACQRFSGVEREKTSGRTGAAQRLDSHRARRRAAHRPSARRRPNDPATGPDGSTPVRHAMPTTAAATAPDREGAS
jgi:hypothetical protein